jgi:hypothetical protein
MPTCTCTHAKLSKTSFFLGQILNPKTSLFLGRRECTTITTSVFDLIYKPRITSFSLWSDVEGHFRDNELERAVLLEAEFHSVQQGELSIHDYCTKLKRLADQLRNVGHPASELSQVLNLFRGLNPTYRHLKPVIKSKSPPHTFRSAMSYLLPEEASDSHNAKTDAAQAFLARSGGSGSGSSSTGSTAGSGGSLGGSAGTPGGATGRSGGTRPKNKKKGRESNFPGMPRGGGGGQQPAPNSTMPWTAGYNPWTGLVQAWSMPIRALALGCSAHGLPSNPNNP